MPTPAEALSSFYEEVGQRIRDYRDESGLTQEALATQIALTRTSITNIEKGRQKILIHTLVDIANTLGKSPLDLLPEGSLIYRKEFDQKTNPKEKLEEMVKDLSTEQKSWVISSSQDLLQGE